MSLLSEDIKFFLVANGFQLLGRVYVRELLPGVFVSIDIGGRPRNDILPFVYLHIELLERELCSLLELDYFGGTGTAGATAGDIVTGKARTWNGSNSQDELKIELFEASRILENVYRVQGARSLIKAFPSISAPFHLILVDIFEGVSPENSLDEARCLYCVAENEVCEQFRRFERNLVRLQASSEEKMLPEHFVSESTDSLADKTAEGTSLVNSWFRIFAKKWNKL
jgi:hypothetical protein